MIAAITFALLGIAFFAERTTGAQAIAVLKLQHPEIYEAAGRPIGGWSSLGAWSFLLFTLCGEYKHYPLPLNTRYALQLHSRATAFLISSLIGSAAGWSIYVA